MTFPPGLQLFRDDKRCEPSSSDKDALEQTRQQVISKYNISPELVPADYHM